MTVPITGQFEYQAGYNANGIVRMSTGRELLVVQYNTGRLFRIDPATGRSTEVDLGAARLPNARPDASTQQLPQGNVTALSH